MPETIPTKGIFVLDTKELFSALEGESFASQSKLERVCRLLGFKPEYLHNAGNDAHVRPPPFSQLNIPAQIEMRLVHNACGCGDDI